MALIFSTLGGVGVACAGGSLDEPVRCHLIAPAVPATMEVSIDMRKMLSVICRIGAPKRPPLLAGYGSFPRGWNRSRRPVGDGSIGCSTAL
jgi:hypothetical protein